MKVYKGVSASPGLVLGQVSRLEHHVETYGGGGPFNPERELQQLEDAIRTAQKELYGMGQRAAATEQAIFQFQSMMLEDEGFMTEVRSYINAGINAAAAMNRVGQRYADRQFLLLIGADNWAAFPRWAHHEDLVRNYDIIVYPREGYELNASQLPPRVHLLQAKLYPWSSTLVRQRLAQRLDCSAYLQPDVLHEILRCGFYGA